MMHCYIKLPNSRLYEELELASPQQHLSMVLHVNASVLMI